MLKPAIFSFGLWKQKLTETANVTRHMISSSLSKLNFNNFFTGIPLLLRVKKFKLYAVMGKKIIRNTFIEHNYKAPIQHKTLKHLLKSIHFNGSLVQVEEVCPQCLLSVCGVICLSYSTELLSLKLKVSEHYVELASWAWFGWTFHAAIR